MRGIIRLIETARAAPGASVVVKLDELEAIKRLMDEVQEPPETKEEPRFKGIPMNLTHRVKKLEQQAEAHVRQLEAQSDLLAGLDHFRQRVRDAFQDLLT